LAPTWAPSGIGRWWLGLLLFSAHLVPGKTRTFYARPPRGFPFGWRLAPVEKHLKLFLDGTPLFLFHPQLLEVSILGVGFLKFGPK